MPVSLGLDWRQTGKVCIGIMLGVSLGACSSDATRLSNPFAGVMQQAQSTNTHYGAGGPVGQPAGQLQARPVAPVGAAQAGAYPQQGVPHIETFQSPQRQAYYSNGASAPAQPSSIAYNQPYGTAVAGTNYGQQTYAQQTYPQQTYPQQKMAMAQYQAQATPSPQAHYATPAVPSNFVTGAVRNYGMPSAPVPITGFGNGWHAEGGTPIIIGQNDTVRLIAARYGVPEDALLSTNGLSSPLQLQPGMRIIIPIYETPQKSAQANGARANAVQQPADSKAPVAFKSPAPTSLAPTSPAPMASKLATQRALAQSQPQGKMAAAGKSSSALKRRPVTKDAGAGSGFGKSQALDAMSAAAVADIPPGLKSGAKQRMQMAYPSKTDAAQPPSPQPGSQALLGLRRPSKSNNADVSPASATLAQTQFEQPVMGQNQLNQAAPGKSRFQAASMSAQTAPPLGQIVALDNGSVAASPLSGTLTQSGLQGGASQNTPAQAQKGAEQQNQASQRDVTSAIDPEARSNDGISGALFRWPVRGRVIQGFGQNNQGLNISVPEGTPVKAAEGGIVAYAGNELKGYGNLVLIRHQNGFVSAYANNGALNVKRGDTVKRGQVIATSGQSGDVSTPQLHFELRKGQQPVDPASYLAGT